MKLKKIWPGVYFAKVPVEKTDVAHLMVCKDYDIFPVRYKDENDSIIREVTEKPGHEKEISSYSNNEFPPHNEAPHRTDAPHWLSLHCINEGVRPNFHIYSIADIEKHIDPFVLHIMGTQKFKFKIGHSWGANGGIADVLIRQAEGQWQYHHANMLVATDVEKEVHNNIDRALRKCQKYTMQLEKGDFVLLSNLSTLHARDFFKNKDTENKRLLHRVYYRNYL